MIPEQKLEQMGLRLPAVQASVGNYETCVQTGNLVFLSGSLSFDFVGKVGDSLTAEDGYEAAKAAALQAIGTLKAHLGELSRVKKFVKLLGFVNCAFDFTEHAKVMNGASDLLVSVFGREIGAHARTTIGAILPRGAAIEIEMVVEVEP